MCTVTVLAKYSSVDYTWCLAGWLHKFFELLNGV